MIELVQRVLSFAAPIDLVIIPTRVFWPYPLGLAVLVIGLPVSIRSQARGDATDNLIAFGPLLFAIPMAIFGGDHLVAARAIAADVPSWVLVALVYIPLTIRNAPDIGKGLNSLAIHLALAGGALMLADALPKCGPAEVPVRAQSEANLHRVSES
jgi:hypothetical protein